VSADAVIAPRLASAGSPVLSPWDLCRQSRRRRRARKLERGTQPGHDFMANRLANAVCKFSPQVLIFQGTVPGLVMNGRSKTLENTGPKKRAHGVG
jgi:hypothetical protein